MRESVESMSVNSVLSLLGDEGERIIGRKATETGGEGVWRVSR